ncbi:hypothetical protein P5W99_36285 [Paraburkholderia sp. A3BS-1L]|uniref:hypothetical protein n=1 Tax=Paraburkholderia sp. A3BS-1L TaxID=3028375 RepID=UPI003DAA3FD2
MMNFLMLLVAAAGTSSLTACTHAQLRHQVEKPVIVVHSPRREQGEFSICDDGRVLVYPASHPKSCA